MSLSDAAWIGPTLVAVVASIVTYWVHKAGLEAERDRWRRERKAAVRDRRLETVRDGYLSLMASAGAFVAVSDQTAMPGERSIVEAYEALKAGLRESGGVVDAFGSDDSRHALERTRQLVAQATVEEDELEAAERLRQVPEPDHEEVLEKVRSAAYGILRNPDEWQAVLSTLLDAMRDDLQRFEAESDTP